GAKFREMVLAEVIDAFRVPSTGRLLWVANMDTTGERMGLHGPPGSVESTPYAFRLIFVDPNSGVVLGESSMGAPLPAN
ncbi:MAG TPA: hypothetical protein VLS25_03855, partial [Dehalococcoidia bacterium]|nr:hypothetical protein [Dehalococcoidia bacterium]